MLEWLESAPLLELFVTWLPAQPKGLSLVIRS